MGKWNELDRAIKLTEALAREAWGQTITIHSTQSCLWIYNHFLFRFIYLEWNEWMNEYMKSNQKCCAFFFFILVSLIQFMLFTCPAILCLYVSMLRHMTGHNRFPYRFCWLRKAKTFYNTYIKCEWEERMKKDLFIVFWHLFFSLFGWWKGEGAWGELYKQPEHSAAW